MAWWAWLLIGLFFGTAIGGFAVCLFVVAGTEYPDVAGTGVEGKES